MMPKNEVGTYEAGMKMAPNYLERTGYRLPTEAEWEYACRAGADTGFSFGEYTLSMKNDLLGKYAWFVQNSPETSQPVGRLKPNDLGLFDMHGNVFEWTQDVFRVYVKSEDGKVTNDIEDRHGISNTNDRVLRGGSFICPAVLLRSANRSKAVPAYRAGDVGFRPARTFMP
jgi:formylglycine-generating enzyme required for sulfatase activity